MNRKADWLDTRKFCAETVGINRLADIDAELILLHAGRKFGVGARVDVRIDSYRDRDYPAACVGELAKPAQLRHRFDVDLVDPGVDRRFELAGGLADPREQDPLRRHAGGKSAAQLSFGNDVGAGPEIGKEAQ